MEAENDQRVFLRAKVSVRVQIVREDGSSLSGEVRDLSMNGMRIATGVSMALGERCSLTIYTGTPADPTTIEASGEVVWQEGDDVGIMVTSVVAESFPHLVRFILQNAVDSSHELGLAGASGISPLEKRK